MNETKSNEDIVRNANVRLCRLRTWTNYKGLGFHIMECSRPPHLISLVESNSPAASGGLKILDVLLAINNKTVSDTDYAQVIITLKTVQKETDFLLELLVVEQHFYKILKKKNIAIQSSLANILNTPIRMPEDYIKFPKHIPRTCQIRLQSKDIDFGFDVISGINGIGMFVQEVIPNSPAYGAGLRKSDRIIEIEDEYVDKNTSKFILEKLRKAAVKKTVKLLVVDTKTYGLYVLNDPCKQKTVWKLRVSYRIDKNNSFSAFLSLEND
jgi:C-terminal processing protease CtpA/Prc